MTSNDFKYLNVPLLLNRYSNPPEDWRETVLALARTQLAVFKKYEMIASDATIFSTPIENVVVMFSDFTDVGREFVMTGAVDKWLASCDRKKDLAAYQDPAPLEKRLHGFLKKRP